jgi:carboxypeptidase C (cathepsin A)
MNFRALWFLVLLGLAACNRESEPPKQTASDTFENLDKGDPVVPSGTATQAASDTFGDSDKGDPVVPADTATQTATIVPEKRDPLDLARPKAAELKAMGKLQDAAGILRAVGLDEEAYKVFAPEEVELTDRIDYDRTSGGLSQPSADKLVDEIGQTTTTDAATGKTRTIKTQKTNKIEAESVAHHSMPIKGKTVWFTAKAGHIIAYGQKDPKTGKKAALASIFYQSYTRDDLPKDKRPVTFLMNGGPGSPSIWLHLGSWAPKRLKVDSPHIPQNFIDKAPERLPLVDNDVTLLDQTDLVFIDAISTGYSQAVAPHTNSEFQGVDSDAALIRDFITSYDNKNNRQSSPKFLYGESYSGIRMPIVGKLLQDASNTNFEPDPTGKPPVSLTGIILNSPILDYNTNVDSNGPMSTNAGAFPTYAMIADYHGKSTYRGNISLDAYADRARDFAKNQLTPYLAAKRGKYGPADKWQVKEPLALHDTFMLGELGIFTGIKASVWQKDLNMWPDTFNENLETGFRLGYYDGRLKANYNPNDYEKTAFQNEIKTLLPGFLNYSTSAAYSMDGVNWGGQQRNSVPDIAQALTNDPELKMLILHGYHDLATPFYQTELDLSAGGLDIPVHVFEGGHMTYYSEPVRAPLKKLLDAYYAAASSPAMN